MIRQNSFASKSSYWSAVPRVKGYKGIPMNVRPRFAFYLVEPVGLEDALEYGVKAEEYGFDAVAACENLFWWTPGQSPTWDNFTVLTTILNRTKKIKVLTDVIDPVKRHPAVVAQMVSTLDNIAKGRIAVGVGAGEKGNYGPLLDLENGYPSSARMKEFLSVMHGVWKSSLERPFNFDGKFFQVRNAFLSLKPSSRPHPPVYVAGMGPRTRRVAAEMADGWLPITYTPESYAKDWKEIQDVAKSVGRDIDHIDPALTIYTVVLENGEKARKIGSDRGRVELLSKPQLLRDLGYSEAVDYKLSIPRRSGPVAETPTDIDLGKIISEKVAATVTISGTPAEAIEQIESFVKAGVRFFVLWIPYEDKRTFKETLENCTRKVLPYFQVMDRNSI